MKFLYPNQKSSCLPFQLNTHKTGVLIFSVKILLILAYFEIQIVIIFVVNIVTRRVRRIMKSPDPLEEQRRKELQQGELGTGGVFG